VQPEPEMELAGLVPVDLEQVLEPQVGPLQSQVFPSSQTKIELNLLFSMQIHCNSKHICSFFIIQIYYIYMQNLVYSEMNREYSISDLFRALQILYINN
jgi:hypothetical protein